MRSLMKHQTIFLFFPAALITGAVLLASCEKQETAAAPSPSPVTVPVTAAQVPDPTPSEEEPALAAVPPEDAAPAVPQEQAIAAFKAEIAAIKKFMQDNEGSEDSAKAMENLKELVTQATSVKTEGLPEDLASAYQRMTKVMSDVQDTLATLPVPVDQFAEYMKQEASRSPEAAQELTAKIQEFKISMEKLQEEGTIAAAKLKDVGAKYGIEGLELGN